METNNHKKMAQILKAEWDDIFLLSIVVLFILHLTAPEALAAIWNGGLSATKTLFSAFSHCAGIINAVVSPTLSWIHGVVAGLCGLGTVAGFFIVSGFSVLAFL